MPVSCTLYSFKKRVNSTAQPSGGSVFSCYLKNETGIINPTFIFDFKSENAPNYNYAYIPDFNRYYFINEWTWIEGNWNASMNVDVLATYKTDIGQSSLFITRSSASSNGFITDNLYPLTAQSHFETIYAESPWETDNIGNGRFIVCVQSGDSTFYSLTQVEFVSLMSYIFSDSYANDVLNGWEEAFPQLKAQLNPMQYITSIYWLPYANVTGNSVNSIRVGWVDCPCSGVQISGTSGISGLVTFNVPRHPQASSRGNYLNGAPFSSYSLFFPPWGIISLDPSLMTIIDTVRAEWLVDLRSGGGTLVIQIRQGSEVGALTELAWVNTQVGVNYAISGLQSNNYTVLSGVLGGVDALSSALSLDVGGVIKGGINCIEDFAKSKIPYTSTLGSNGGLNALRGQPHLTCQFFLTTSDDNANKGRPLCTTTTPAALGGYMIALEGDVEIEGTDYEMDKIKNYLEGGFYYE